MMNKESFGSKLRIARKNKGFTQKELAGLINAKHNSISNWENDQNKPDPDTIELICKALDITPNYLLNTDSKDLTPEELSIIEKFRKLDPLGKEVVLFILDHEINRLNNLGTIQDQRKQSFLYFPKPVSINSDFVNCKIMDFPVSELSNNELDADFIIEVNGNSMENYLYDGDKVFVKRQDSIPEGEIGLFIVDNTCYIKIYNRDRLISANPKYSDIILSETDDIRCLGLAVSVKIKEGVRSMRRKEVLDYNKACLVNEMKQNKIERDNNNSMVSIAAFGGLDKYPEALVSSIYNAAQTMPKGMIEDLIEKTKENE